MKFKMTIGYYVTSSEGVLIPHQTITEGDKTSVINALNDLLTSLNDFVSINCIITKSTDTE